MNDDLKYIFNTINDWLKFAEAKNAGLFALNVAFIIGILQANFQTDDSVNILVGTIIVLFSISSCFCLISILPILNKWFRFYKKLDNDGFKKAKSDNNLNLLYFGDLVKLSSTQFIELFEFKNNVTLTLSEKDFGNQITNNSEICWQKFKLFSWAAWISFTSFILAIIMIINFYFI